MARVRNFGTIDKQSLLEVAKPVHIQRLEKALDLIPYLQSVEQTIDNSIKDKNIDDYKQNSNSFDDAVTTKSKDTSVDKLKLYNFIQVSKDREWLKSMILESSDSSNESSSDEITKKDYSEMLKHHTLLKKYKKKYYENEDNRQYQCYTAEILSNCKYPKRQKCDNPSLDKNYDLPDDLPQFKEIFVDKFNITNNRSLLKKNFVQMNPEIMTTNNRSLLKKNFVQINPEIMTTSRRKVWILMCKKEIAKVQSTKINNYKEKLESCQKIAQLCMRQCQQKEILWRTNRTTHEMQSYGRMENEPQREMNIEIIAAKRQQRKLNCFITQIELYAHFISKKLRKTALKEELQILSQLDEEMNPQLLDIDDYNSEAVKAKTKKNAEDTFAMERIRTRQYDIQANLKMKSNVLNDFDEDHPQPLLFNGYLKNYLLRGMNWLASLYDQGINGILADEKGLGKTVQSIALLCHIAEKYSVWGPFLIISPASTLPRWQQEMEKFVPSFKVVSYWDNPKERQILRQSWDQKDMHTKDASFHVVLTSYQMVITDYKYFCRVKWQYIILDETQTIQSTNSFWWKMVLGLVCRNRLLLRGLPIQDSMAELLPLLYFIIPTIFDLHYDYNQWFSENIDSHTEKKTNLVKKDLSRLHMILKPFILQRIKKDVETELSGKIEILVSFPLITKQNLLYMTLKKKIRVEDLSDYTSTMCEENKSYSVDTNFTSVLTNVVKHFRKVYNHPDLFERRNAKLLSYIECIDYNIPKFLYEYCILNQNLLSKQHILYNLLYIFACEHIRNSTKNYELYATFSFLHYLYLSPVELFEIMNGNVLFRWLHNFKTVKYTHVLYHQRFWENNSKPNHVLIYSDFRLSVPQVNSSQILQDMIFTAVAESNLVYTYIYHVCHSVPETMQHRSVRSRMGHHRTNETNVEDKNKKILVNGNAVPLLNESSSDEITKEDYLEMLRHHVKMKKYKTKYYRKKNNGLYQFYNARILLNKDEYPNYQMCVSCSEPKELKDYSCINNYNLDFDNDLPQFKEKLNDCFNMENRSLLEKKFVQKKSEVTAARRRKVWILMCKKEIGEIQRTKAKNYKEKLESCKKTAQICKNVVSLLNELDGKMICSERLAVSFFEETSV